MAALIRRSAVLTMLYVTAALSMPARAVSSVEVAVKATYIVKFAHYVTWPASALSSPAAPIVVCIVGRDRFGATIDAAAKGDRIDQHPIIVRRMAAIDRSSGCSMAYLSGDVAARSLAAVDGSPILTITDASETAERGVFQFEVRGGHVGFNIDDKRAGRGGLGISSRLLSIALSVSSRETRQ